jgi:ATP-dependent Clp protease ATP-binding subunit ClpC
VAAIASRTSKSAAKWRDAKRELKRKSRTPGQVDEGVFREKDRHIKGDIAPCRQADRRSALEMEEGETKKLLREEADSRKRSSARKGGRDHLPGAAPGGPTSRSARRSARSSSGADGVGKTLWRRPLAEFCSATRLAIARSICRVLEKLNVSRWSVRRRDTYGEGEGRGPPPSSPPPQARPPGPPPFRTRWCSSTNSTWGDPDVMHMLLQILEEGRFTDTLGRRIDFRNTISS